MAVMKVYTGGEWVMVGAANAGISQPYVKSANEPDTALLWMDEKDDNILKYYNGTSWVPVTVGWG